MPEPRTLRPEQWELWNAWMQAHRVLQRDLDRDLQRAHGISKADFSVLVTLHRTPSGALRVGELADSLDWEKSRVAHQLTRMEARDLIARTGSEPSGRRLSVALTPAGRTVVEAAIQTHAENIHRYFFDALTPPATAAIRAWTTRILTRAQDAADTP